MKKFIVKGCKVAVFHIYKHSSGVWREIFESEKPSWAVMVGGNVYSGFASRAKAIAAIDGEIL